MCGIAGSIGRDRPDEPRISATLVRMKRRGPDARGHYQMQLGDSWVTLLHTRLAVIDLDPRADQPFVGEGCVLISNAEIYNYRELRSELEALGHEFLTQSDTEVILRSWREWGRDCVGRFEGMWAIALFDQRTGELFLSRDPFGEKPLYTMRHRGTLYFGSEVKLLSALSGHCPAVNAAQLRRFLVNGYRSLYKQRETYFETVRELPPGTSMVVSGAGTVGPEPYWRLEHAPVKMSLADAVEGTRERLVRAIELRLRADVPVAFCLSGGIDSGALATIATQTLGQTIHAFSIVDSDPRYDESENLRVVAAKLGCRHDIIHTNSEGFLDRLADLVDYHDAPVATISYYVHAFLSQAIHEGGYKVAISGTGADELFTGYYDHYAFWLASMAERDDFEALIEEWRDGYGRFVRNPFLRDPYVFHRNPGERGHLYLGRDRFNDLLVQPLEEDFFESDFSRDPLRNRMLNELWHESVPLILHEDDLNSMHWSVENRSPFLDRELARFLYSVPNEHLVLNGRLKGLLRAVTEGLLPDQVRLDHYKRGFNASIDSLLDRSDPDVVERLLEPSPIFDYVHRARMAEYIRGDMSENADSKFLFSFVSAKLFLETGLASGRAPVDIAA